MRTCPSRTIGGVLVALAVGLASVMPASAQPIPADRRTDWSYAGVYGGIPNYGRICHTFTPATGTAAAVAAKIVECGATYPNGSVVLLAAGTYVWDATVPLATSKVILRGAGADQTIIKHSPGNARLVSFGWGYLTTENIAITGGGAKDSFSFTVSSATGLSVGQIIELARDDQSFVYTRYPGRNHVQVNRITAINGTTITVQNPLHFDFSTGTPKIWHAWVGTKTGVGLEDLKLDHTDYTGGSVTTVQFDFCYNCWVKGVESYKSRNHHFMFETVLNCEIRDSYVHESMTYGSNNSGVLIAPGGNYGNVSSIKVENTIFDKLFPASEVFGSTSGNVWGYNFVSRPQSAATSIWVTWSLNDGHAPHPVLNLYEGNITPMIGTDGYFGSASHGTLFRNLVTGITPGLRGPTVPLENGSSIWLKRFSYYYNIVGNVLGSTQQNPSHYESPSGGNAACGGWCANPYELGWPNIGNDSMTPGDGWYPTGQSSYPDKVVKSTLLRWGNYDFYYRAVRWEPSEIPAGVPVPGDHTLPNSYYLTSKPSWFGSVAWPPIGPDVVATTHGGVGTEDASGHANKIPAQLCWESRNLPGGGTFSASACYGSQPAPPANLKIR